MTAVDASASHWFGNVITVCSKSSCFRNTVFLLKLNGKMAPDPLVVQAVFSFKGTNNDEVNQILDKVHSYLEVSSSLFFLTCFYNII